jgi:hypothetical protein
MLRIRETELRPQASGVSDGMDASAEALRHHAKSQQAFGLN